MNIKVAFASQILSTFDSCGFGIPRIYEPKTHNIFRPEITACQFSYFFKYTSIKLLIFLIIIYIFALLKMVWKLITMVM